MLLRIVPLAFGCLAAISFCSAAFPDVTLRFQVETEAGSGRYHRLTRQETWEPSQTAIIVCDMWDSHHCYRAVRREKEFAPILNQVLHVARDQGTVIIHAPSGCMETYKDHAARQRAMSVAPVASYPDDIASWCYKIPSEEAGDYPIDQTDGGEDDTPEESAAWEKVLRSEGRDVQRPWKKQIDLIDIDTTNDYISDQGKEVWNILQSHGIKNVILAGVHTNMCVLGRPFGLRRMAAAKMNVALMRDMTDTMYNPAAKPFVSHFSGTDLIIDHIERYVCPTVTSSDWTGAKPFRFAADDRPTIAIIMSESEYETATTLPPFAEALLRKNHRLTFVFGSATDSNELPGVEQISEADAIVLSVRRRTLPESQLDVVRQYVASGKPVIGIRTASHGFSLRQGEAPEGHAQWTTFDQEVFGGNYTNHYGNDQKPSITISRMPQTTLPKPIEFVSRGSLYRVSPIDSAAKVLATGAIDGHPAEPVAWTFTRSDGGKSFYTSLGAKEDFQEEAFLAMLAEAVEWACSQ